MLFRTNFGVLGSRTVKPNVLSGYQDSGKHQIFVSLMKLPPSSSSRRKSPVMMAQPVTRSPVSRSLRRSETSMSLLAVPVMRSSPVLMGEDSASGVRICGRCSSALMARFSPQRHSTNLLYTPTSKSL
jgi:hypothetical protein